MKITDLQKIDQNIIKILADHKGIDKAINGKMLAQSLNVDFRTLQGRIAFCKGRVAPLAQLIILDILPLLMKRSAPKALRKKKTWLIAL